MGELVSGEGLKLADKIGSFVLFATRTNKAAGIRTKRFRANGLVRQVIARQEYVQPKAQGTPR